MRNTAFKTAVRYSRHLLLIACGLIAAGWLTPAHAQQEEEPLVSDRPDFTESAATVPMGRIQLESGWTYTYDRDDHGTAIDSHTLPEILLRIGLNEWIELRLDWAGWTSERTVDDVGHSNIDDGANDFGIGAKIRLWDECECCGRPEMALLIDTSVPSGSAPFRAGEMQPRVALLYSWTLTEDLSLGANTGIASLNDDGDGYTEFAQSLSLGYALTDRWGTFAEWFALLPTDRADNRPEYYFNSGFTYLVTSNFQLDWRAGLGLNDYSQDFFTGAGFVYRY